MYSDDREHTKCEYYPGECEYYPDECEYYPGGCEYYPILSRGR